MYIQITLNERLYAELFITVFPTIFLKNLQGDVIAIIDKDAKTVAECSYNACGTVTSAVRLDCIIYRVDTMMLVLEGLYFDAKYINKVIDIVNKIIDQIHKEGKNEKMLYLNHFTYFNRFMWV